MTDKLLAPGQILSARYRIQEYLAEGGMQQVFLARDELFDRDVVVKAPKNLSATKRFKRSAVVSAKVNHIGVAKTLDYIEDGATSYLVEEYVRGEDLSVILKVRVERLDPHLVSKMLHSLAKGLAASHHVEVIHRDLKPSNIMVVNSTKFSGVKITDFGIAKMATEEIAEVVEGGVDERSLNASQTAMGALPYMSPEAIESLRTAGKPADVWAIAAVTFEMLTGQKPFGVGIKAAQKILNGEKPVAPASAPSAQFDDLKNDVIGVIADCFSEEPSKRPTADELVQRCERLCYSFGEYQEGVVRKLLYQGSCGFIRSGDEDAFFHQDSVFADRRLKPGEQALYRMHRGGGNGRAFPVIAMKVN